MDGKIPMVVFDESNGRGRRKENIVFLESRENRRISSGGF